jgi:GMP synthase-like glutamine amidotransferase
LKKFRPHINLERAIMAVRFSDEIFGTQFHPEANPESLIENLKDEKNKEAMIENFGWKSILKRWTELMMKIKSS